jgi:hypothetical protein
VQIFRPSPSTSTRESTPSFQLLVLVVGDGGLLDAEAGKGVQSTKPEPRPLSLAVFMVAIDAIQVTSSLTSDCAHGWRLAHAGGQSYVTCHTARLAVQLQHADGHIANRVLPISIMFMAVQLLSQLCFSWP